MTRTVAVGKGAEGWDSMTARCKRFRAPETTTAPRAKEGRCLPVRGRMDAGQDNGARVVVNVRAKGLGPCEGRAAGSQALAASDHDGPRGPQAGRRTGDTRGPLPLVPAEGEPICSNCGWIHGESPCDDIPF